MLKKKHGKSHTMELPRQIVVGEKNIDQVGDFLKSLSNPKKVSITVSYTHLRAHETVLDLV